MTSRNDQPETSLQVAPDGESAAASGRVLAHDPGAPEDAPMVEAAQLFGGHRQVVIGHNGCRYVLRITKHGKLILNK
jgi:hemin uptake protein HemP